MIVNSFVFIAVFPIIFAVYLLLNAFRKGGNRKITNIFLLLTSYALYWYYNKVLTLVLLGVTLVTWAGALAAERKYRVSIVLTTIALALLPLLAFKYYNFLNTNLTQLFALSGLDFQLPGLNIAVPLGISFFTLQAVGYFIDVAKGKVAAEKNLPDYMLFVAFFPQIASGPISKASDFLPQIKRQRSFCETQVVAGLKWLLWGMFMKVVADNIGEAITTPLAKSALYTSPTVFTSVLLYSMQIYCDFAGYSFMALGLGKLFGFELINNFERPYLSTSVTEFWHRWHRSLSIWLKDYIYIPLGGSHCSKWRSYLNILATFLVSGLWHGANWTFVLWGGMHGLAQIVEKHIGLNKYTPGRVCKPLLMLLTFSIVTCAWVFFNHPDITSAVATFKCMFASTGKRTVDMTLALILCGVVIIKDLADEYNWKHLKVMQSEHTAVRWAAYCVLITCIMTMAVYGEKFIYSGF